MTARGRVFVVGSVNLDTITVVPSLPRPGETVRASATRTAPGGKGANQAAAAAAAGAEVRLLGRVGADAAGRRLRAHLEARGVDCALLRDDAAPTGAALVVVDESAENLIVVRGGANDAVAAADLAGLVQELRPGDVVSLQFELPDAVVQEALAQASRAGATSILNPSPWRDRPELLAAADVVVVNEIEALALGSRIGDERVCVTAGSAGARWGGHHVEAPAIVPVDTTGAGDAFTGALAAGLAAGAPPLEALTGAVAAGSEACLRAQAQEWAGGAR
jgi:ribokinase